VALDEEETARGRVSIHLTSDSEGVDDVCNKGDGGANNDGGESFLTEDDIGCTERVGGEGVNNIIQ
jgi:hypothetical protein